MNRLFPIPLLGQGTSEIESLPSYVFRLAYEHGISVGALLKAIDSIPEFSRSKSRGWPGGRAGIEDISRVNGTSKKLRTILSELTGQDLFCSTLDFLEAKVFRVSCEITGFRWCPECFLEMSEIGSTRYIKQLWHMIAITHCPLHKTPLVANCPKCGTGQFSMKAELHIGWCSKCGQSLASRQKPLSAADIQPSWGCQSSDIYEIFTTTAREKHSKSEPLVFKHFNREIIDNYILGRVKQGFLLYGSEDRMTEYLERGKGNFWSLPTLRRLAYVLNVTLYDLLSENYGMNPLFHEETADKELPNQFKPKKKVRRNHKEEYQKLLKLVAEQSFPPSLKKLARLSNVSVGYLEYRFPNLVRKVVEESQTYQKQQKMIRGYEAQAAAIRFFTDDRYADHSQSRKEAYRVLKEETGLPKWVLKNAIQDVYGVLNSDKKYNA
ncbi:TniQ family protein [Thalassolituus oleivorans]|jgi:hypothetical protein|uniref:TniQ family protein n=1 Tax=Thalassolituus oleivorans TaxID=187493 RepID=UPI00034686D4|nr:TniQ family protein [Thalassolituus oleivorans]APR68197.1 hypothetical protein CN03_15385 [Thalassolituus oleivorans]PHQ83295.1 MAG: hypothetical protein COB58_14085 [Thalassobium sp.]PHQ87959.1 MAG: hypothetical protein COB58_01935 [Thalassobium sp.]|tara:strand:+ start:22993 stop:24303 length:1311 start_codon:yes stop_codon:yes gene_type:complete